MMKRSIITVIRIIGFFLVLIVVAWAVNKQIRPNLSILIIFICSFAIFPVCWIGRRLLDANPTKNRMTWVTIIVHYTLMLLIATALFKAIQLVQMLPAWIIPVPSEIGLILMVLTGAIEVLTVVNLALQGLGAPFAIKLTQQLAEGKLYAWTRNPMVLSLLAFLVSVGIWLRSFPFILWIILIITPAFIFMLRIYEERELEIRFGNSY
ncbi:hypothetical protein GWN26_05650 [Candidatus Saccharibacteria bacterium]|nr:hypothetical protein [Candidatus Saccharibacteria bacterium]NIW78901.1 hypothetical protein [Calditrichia bacterium]